jgi:hypothetical protein
LSARKPSARRSRIQIRRQSPSNHTLRQIAGDGNGHSADSGDDESAPPHSLRMQIAMHSRQRLYAY